MLWSDCVAPTWNTNYFLQFLLFVGVFCASGTAMRAQNIELDSISNKNRHIDSVKYEHSRLYDSDTAAGKQEIDTYKKIEQRASKRKLTGQLFSLIVNMPAPLSEDEEPEAIHEDYLAYEGRIIKDIKVIVLPPFGSDINRPDSANMESWLENSANKLHIATKHYVIKDKLLFRKGDRINPLNIAEAEVFLRSTGFINDARIHIDSISGSDEAEITVIVRDMWSIGFEIYNISTRKVGFNLFDKNFVGAGNNAYIRGIFSSQSNRHFGYGLGYYHYNLRRSFVNLGGFYHDEILNKAFELSAERPLRSTLKFFGQVGYAGNMLDLNHSVWDSVTPTQINNFSVSLGYAFSPIDKLTDGRLVLSARYIDKNTQYRGVNYMLDTMMYHHVANKMILMQISLYRQKYYRDYLIHAFGTTENVAYGYNVSLQIGYNHRPHFEHNGLYLSLKSSIAKQFDYGNFFLQGAVSSYFGMKPAYDGVLNLQLKYFSPLIGAGRSRFRFLLNFNYAKGLNLVPEFKRYLYFSQISTMDTKRFNSAAFGTERLMFNVENNMFTPWNLAGFKFMLFSFLDLGWISNQDISLVHSRNLYWGTGMGIRIRNDLLVFRTLEIKLGWYPRLNQSGFDSFFKFSSSTPSVSANFTPKYPEEIPLSF
jgi:outer membrane protein assembly factor BamA